MVSDFHNYTINQKVESYDSCVKVGGHATTDHYPSICVTRQGKFYYDYRVVPKPLVNIVTSEFSEGIFNHWKSFADKNISFKYPPEGTVKSYPQYKLVQLNILNNKYQLSFNIDNIEGKNIKEFFTNEYITNDTGRTQISDDIWPIKVGEYDGYQAITMIVDHGETQYIGLISPDKKTMVTIETIRFSDDNTGVNNINKQDISTLRQIISSVKFVN